MRFSSIRSVFFSLKELSSGKTPLVFPFLRLLFALYLLKTFAVGFEEIQPEQENDVGDFRIKYIFREGGNEYGKIHPEEKFLLRLPFLLPSKEVR